ncbi:MAG: KH domain-containing protein [Clostridia bacterium]
MEELLTYIAKNLVDSPDEVAVTETKRGDGEFLYELRVASGDMGKIIGKHGRIAKEIRAIMKSAAVRRGIKVSVDIVD